MDKSLRVLPLVLGCLTVAACAPEPAKLKPAAPPPTLSCADFSFPIYFEKGSDQLSTTARAVLLAGVDRAKGCHVSKIEVLGLADADGPASRNLVLSRQRAVTVAHAMEGAGLPTPAFDIEAIGEAGAKSGGKAEPLRRRTEVLIHESAPAH